MNFDVLIEKVKSIMNQVETMSYNYEYAGIVIRLKVISVKTPIQITKKSKFSSKMENVNNLN